MITIRNAQMHVFAQSDCLEFEQRLVDHLKAEYPDDVSTMPEDELPAFVHQAVERSLQYDIEIEVDVASFVEVTLVWGACWEQRPESAWAAEILQDSSQAGRLKMRAIRARFNRGS